MGVQNLPAPAWRITMASGSLREAPAFVLPPLSHYDYPLAVSGEVNMADDPFKQFAIPDQLRTFAEQSVVQARKALEGFIEAANQAVGQMQGPRRGSA